RAGVARVRIVRDWAVGVGAAALMWVRISPGPSVDVSGAGEFATLALGLAAGGALVWRRRRPDLAGAAAAGPAGLYALVAGPVLPVVGWLAIVVMVRHVPSFPVAVRGAAVCALGV